MKNPLWIVIVVTLTFTCFLLGYSLPPLIESGMIGKKSTQVGLKPKLDQKMKDYYRNLQNAE